MEAIGAFSFEIFLWFTAFQIDLASLTIFLFSLTNLRTFNNKLVKNLCVIFDRRLQPIHVKREWIFDERH